MKERPILFSGSMVRAILDGSKTQTRRKVSAYVPSDTSWFMTHGVQATGMSHSARPTVEVPFKYGKPGDRLWVRETWYPNEPTPWYRADFIERYQAWERDTPEGILRLEDAWKPSIHMPRWASRLTLEIVSVRVERLQDISEADAKAEGLKACSKDGTLIKYGIPDMDGLPGGCDVGWPWGKWDADPRKAYRALWESINGPGSWEANPWVWVVEFKKLEVKQ